MIVIWSNGALVPVTEYVYCLGPAGAGGGAGAGGAGGGTGAGAGAGAGGGASLDGGGGGGGGSLDGGGGGGGAALDGGGDACGGVVTMISSCIGGVDVGAVLGVASLVVSVRANSSDTETTRAIAATIAAIPTIHGQRAVLASAS